MAEEKNAAVALDEGTDLADKKAAPAITCPHCGAPVKYSADDGGGGAGDADGDAGGDAMDEGGGDADALEELDDAPATELDEELAEASTDADTDGDAGIERTQKKAMPVAADDEAALDDTDLDEAALDDDGGSDLDEYGGPSEHGKTADTSGGADNPSFGKQGAAMKRGKMPQPGSVSAAGVKVPPKSPAKGAAPPPVPMRERRLLAAAARLEKRLALRERRDRIRAVRAMLQRGLREGKLTPRMIGTPQKPTMTRRFAFRDPKGFKAWLDKEAPIVVEFKERGTAHEVKDSNAMQLSENIDRMAKDKMKADSALDYKTATMRVLSENARLREDYEREMSRNDARQVTVVSTASAIR